MKKAYNINVNGLVQGVGFRPFVYRLAKRYHLKGWVCNRNDCVDIHISGENRAIEKFIDSLKCEVPPVASISSLSFKEEPYQEYGEFEIMSSHSLSSEITEVSPDLAVCENCLDDLKNQEHRKNYPFINCTYCGPRFSIIKSLPYDRPNTTMSEFKMCAKCEEEYNNVLDRRFHAQPIACNECGPHYSFFHNGRTVVGDQKIIEKVAKIINDEGIVSIKGIGGYFIACDALSSNAVGRLRKNKKRYGKPFAVLFKDIGSIKKYAFVNATENQLLESIKRPIVLLKLKRKFTKGVTNGLKTIGAMLPYMPFHYQLFQQLKTDALVLTSGNLSEEPIVIDDKIAIEKLLKLCDGIVSYNRSIHNRVDDSVAMVTRQASHLVRRSRGYAPEPILLNLDCEGIFAAGAELVNCFGIGKGDKIILSQHIGDLKKFETYSFYQESYHRFEELFRFSPSLVASDMHPDYLSTQFAEKFDAPLIKIQHHHAHMASCMAENEHFQKTIGICFDGTGYGTDGKIWGGEFLVGDLDAFERSFQFEYVPICGGDKAAYLPWRSALSYLYFHGFDQRQSLEFLGPVKRRDALIAQNCLEKNVNCTPSSSAGRLFDAVAALTGVCYEASYHAQAPMQLESRLTKNCPEAYQFEIFDKQISFGNTITDILEDLKHGVSVGEICTKFHNTIIDVIVRVSMIIRDEHYINTVALSGGTFQNRYILEKSVEELERKNFKVLTQKKVPSNDGGIALGQMAIAAYKRKELCV